MTTAKTRSYHTGLDIFTPAPGECKSRACGACGTTMDVARNVTAATGRAEAMAGKSHLHDRFTCPHAGEAWHDQVIKLRVEQAATASRSITNMLEEEIDDIVWRKTPTK